LFRFPVIVAMLASLPAGSWLAGCTRPAVVPPTASIPSPRLSAAPELGMTTPIPAPPAVIASPSRWKPSSPPRDWKYIVLHHTATTSGSVESIHEAHLKRTDKSGNHWLGIGYHFVIGNGNGMADGEIEPTFRWKQQMHGAHAGGANKEYNQRGIGICLVGNFENAPPSAAQRRAVKLLVETLKAEYHIASSQVVAHKDIRATECPGKLFPMSEVAGDDRFLFPQAQRLSGAGPGDVASPGSFLR